MVRALIETRDAIMLLATLAAIKLNTITSTKAFSRELRASQK